MIASALQAASALRRTRLDVGLVVDEGYMARETRRRLADEAAFRAAGRARRALARRPRLGFAAPAEEEKVVDVVVDTSPEKNA